MTGVRALSFTHIATAFIAFFIATFLGLLQILSRAGLFGVSGADAYYTFLSAHGVLLAYFFTTFFICGLATYTAYHTVENTNSSLVLGWLGWGGMTLGALIAGAEIAAGNASVLWTFYAPLKASPWFYIGLCLFFAATWFVVWDVFNQYYHYRRLHPDGHTPLGLYFLLVTFIMWFLASLGVVAELTIQLIPWSLGWTDHVNVMMTRMLYWYFAHPLVYFWLLPAFVIWYLVVPRILGVHVFGDSAARIAFILLLVLSMPLGIHHQFEDPAISVPTKLIVSAMTLAVVVPSLMTAFAMFGTFENYAAKKGIRTFFGIIRSLPWQNPTFAGCALAMLLFILGGFGGIVQGSYTMNELVHNTMFIPGHIHATVAGPVGLTFIAASYMLIPALLKRRQPNQGLALAQCWLYFLGFVIMAAGMHVQGLMGDPRRVSFPYYGGAAIAQSWEPWSIAAAVGGCVIYVSVILYFVAFLQMCFGARDLDATFEFATPDDESRSPMILERLGLWTGAAIFLILIAYVDPILYQWHAGGNAAAGLRTW